jgi:hypothetical protein
MEVVLLGNTLAAGMLSTHSRKNARSSFWTCIVQKRCDILFVRSRVYWASREIKMQFTLPQKLQQVVIISADYRKIRRGLYAVPRSNPHTMQSLATILTFWSPPPRRWFLPRDGLSTQLIYVTARTEGASNKGKPGKERTHGADI